MIAELGLDGGDHKAGATMKTVTSPAHALQPEAGRPDFSEPVPSGGYLWWYVDGMSDDGRHGVTIIAFVGSVFSPYYRRALAKGPADPEDHVAINVVVYGPGGRWAMTERGKRQVTRDAASFRVGPSQIGWRDGAVSIRIDERCAPLPRRLRGEIRLRPKALTGRSFALDESGRHFWRPIAPVGRIEVALDEPGLAWTGSGYFDSNRGERLPEHDFLGWDWSRSPASDGATILYDMRRREGGRKILALKVGEDGGISDFAAPAEARLPAGRLWRASRATLCDAGYRPTIVQTLEDTPFYTRSLIRTQLGGETLTSFHESLLLDRLSKGWVQRLLPFRMPRWTR